MKALHVSPLQPKRCYTTLDAPQSSFTLKTHFYSSCHGRRSVPLQPTDFTWLRETFEGLEKQTLSYFRHNKEEASMRC